MTDGEQPNLIWQTRLSCTNMLDKTNDVIHLVNNSTARSDDINTSVDTSNMKCREPAMLLNFSSGV